MQHETKSSLKSSQSLKVMLVHLTQSHFFLLKVKLLPESLLIFIHMYSIVLVHLRLFLLLLCFVLQSS